MTVTANTTRNDYVGNGQSVYNYTFQLNDASDVTVYLDGVVQTLNTHYTVENVGVGTGGTITFTLVDENNNPIHPSASNTISIVMEMDLDRDTNYQQSGFFAASDVNNDFDRLWLAANQQQTRLGRSIHIANNDLNRDMFLPLYNQRANKVLAFDSNGNVIVGPLVSDTNTIAGISTDISTVAGISANVTTVSGIAPNVTTVAGISSDVTTVAGLNASHLGTVATNINSINTVATNASDVVSVAGKITEVETVADDLDLGANSLVKEVADDLALGNNSLIKEVADNMTDVTNASNLVTATVATGSEGTNVTYDANTGVLTVPRGATGNTGPTGLTGATGDGFTGGSYDPSTGRITFTSDDGLGFFTSDVRGAASTVPGPTGPTGPQGAQGIQGNPGDQGDGWTGASYNANDGTITFTSIDGLGFQTGDLRGVKGDTGSDGPQGPQGPTGLQGPQGLEGPQGEQGAAGPAGASATAAGSLVYNGSTKLQAYSGGINVSNDVSLPDNGRAKFGASDDLQIYHDTGNSVIADKGTGDLYLQGSNTIRLTNDDATEHYAKFNHNGGVELRHDNNIKFNTTSTGIDVTGSATMDGLVVDGGLDVNMNTGVADFSFNDGGYLKIHNASRTSDYRISTIGSSAQELRFRNGASQDLLRLNKNGDISFYEDTGTTPKFFWDASAERLGIGTTSPSANLHVSSSGDTIARITSADGNSAFLDLGDASDPDGGRIVYDSGSNLALYTASTERMRIDSSGKVGIGTTNPSTALEVAGSAPVLRLTDTRNLGNGSWDNVSMGALQFYTSDTTSPSARVGAEIEAFSGTGAASGPEFQLIFKTSSNLQSATERMRIDSSGNVRIGTVLPQTSANFNLRRNGTNIEFGHGNRTSGYYGTLGAQYNSGQPFMGFSCDADDSGNTFTTRGFKGNVLIGTTTGDLTFNQLTSASASGQTPAERMRIDSSGRVLVGTASVGYAGVDLTVGDTADSQNGLAIQTSTTGNGYLLFGDGSGASAYRGQINYKHGDDYMAFHTANAERMRIDSSGNVGIGTNSPFGRLSVNVAAGAPASSGNMTNGFTIHNNNGGRAIQLGVNETGAYNYLQSAYVNNANVAVPMAFFTGNEERMRIDSSGNLLVGTTDSDTGNAGSSKGIALGSVGYLTVARNGATPIYANRLSGDGEVISIRKDGAPVGSIGTVGGDMYVGTGDTGIRFDDATNHIRPCGVDGANLDATIDIGDSARRFKDLYLSGGVKGSTLTFSGNGSSEHARIDTSGNVGIGTASPATKLDVNGSVKIEGETTFNDSITFNSDATGSGAYDLIATFNAKDSASTFEEAGRIATLGQSFPPSRLVIGQAGCGITFFDFMGSRVIQPVYANTGGTSDAVVDLGSYAARFKLGRFSSGTTTSSDRNEKRDIEELTEAELRVAARCKPLLRKYRRIDAYEEKGEDARIHFGIIAQDLDDAFTAEGLDAHRYAMFMEDTWYETEESGHPYTSLEQIPEDLRSNAVEKTRMGVRYEQLLAFIIAAI